MVRVAAVGDLHTQEGSEDMFRPIFEDIHRHADVLLLAGDLTRHGRPVEAEVLVSELSVVEIPTVAVMGNHEYHEHSEGEIMDVLARENVTVLDGEATTVELDGGTVGVVGTKGFCGGFGIRALPKFGEEILKLVFRTAEAEARRVEEGLRNLDTDYRVALLHYSPIRDTLKGESREVYPFLGNSLLAEAIDAAGADLVIHGHAHYGVEYGQTPGGIPVRNVPMPLLGRAYAVYEL